MYRESSTTVSWRNLSTKIRPRRENWKTNGIYSTETILYLTYVIKSILYDKSEQARKKLISRSESGRISNRSRVKADPHLDQCDGERERMFLLALQEGWKVIRKVIRENVAYVQHVPRRPFVPGDTWPSTRVSETSESGAPNCPT